MTLRLGVLASGAGTNFQAMIDDVAEGRLDARVEVLISNVPGAKVLERAEAAGVPAVPIDQRDFGSRMDFDAAILGALREHGAEWIALAGFMRLLGPTLLDAFPNRILNIHPALLPSFPGTRATQDAISGGVTISGCTVHLIDSGVDTGPILAQAAVPVLPSDDAASLAARIQVQERLLYPRVLQAISEGRLSSIEGRPRLESRGELPSALVSPPLPYEGGPR